MFHMKEYETVSIEKINEIIKNRELRGLFLAREPKGTRKRMFIAVDNTTSEAWTEEFEKFSEEYVLKDIEENKLSKKCLWFIKTDIEHQEHLGMDCDKRDWQRLLKKIDEVMGSDGK